MGKAKKLAALVVLLALPAWAGADVLHDTLFIVDDMLEANAIANTIGGYLVWGREIDSQVCDDFNVPGPGYYIDTVTTDYIGYIGSDPYDGVLIEVFADLGGYPAETPTWSHLATGGEIYNDIYNHYWGGAGYRITTTLPYESLGLAAGNWFVSQTPVDTSNQSDGYFYFRDARLYYGADSYVRNGGVDHATDGWYFGGYGGVWPGDDWSSAASAGYGPADSSFQVTGHAMAGCPYSVGDANCDGAVDFFDIDVFIDYLLNGTPPCALCTVDALSDNVLDFFDIDPFINCVLAGGC